jgi:hypothetical protein
MIYYGAKYAGIFDVCSISDEQPIEVLRSRDWVGYFSNWHPRPKEETGG